MIESRQQEFAELSRKAKQCLEQPGVNLPHHKLLLRLWRFSSFDLHSSWFLYSPLPRYGPSEISIVVAVVWDQAFDVRRLEDPFTGLTQGFSIEPTVSLRQAEVPSEQLESRLASLSSVALPIVVDDRTIGLDGEIFGIETFGLKAALSVTWWCQGSAGWKSLIAWAEEFRSFLDECLERRPLASTAI